MLRPVLMLVGAIDAAHRVSCPAQTVFVFLGKLLGDLKYAQNQLVCIPVNRSFRIKHHLNILKKTAARCAGAIYVNNKVN